MPNVICKITSKKRGGGQDVLSYLDERTKSASIPLKEIDITPIGALIGTEQLEAERLFLEKANNPRWTKRPQFVRMVFSFSNEYELALRKKRLNPKRCIAYIADAVLEDYSETISGNRFSLFCFRGLHQETDNLHVHVAFATQTVSGRFTPTSTAKLNEDNEKRPDYFMFFSKRANIISRKILENPPLRLFDDEELLREAKNKKMENALKAYENGGRLAFLLTYRKAIAKTKKDSSGELVFQKGHEMSAGEGVGESQTISVGKE